MTDISKEAVDALLHGVTGKSWKVRKGIQDDEVEIAPTSINGKTKPEFGQWGEIATVPIWSSDGKANARFIAASRKLVPAQAAEIERLRAALDEAEARAMKAEAERDAANALLRDVVEACDHFRLSGGAIDTARAHLGAKP